jgi:integrase
VGRLTVKGVEGLTIPGRYSDGDGSGFHLRVAADGGKYYILRVNVDGKRKDVAIGSAKRITLSAAREKARRIRSQLDTSGQIAENIPTFAEAAKLAHASRTIAYRNEKHKAQWLSTLETYANPIMGEKRVDQVGRSDVIKTLEPIWLEKPETASRVLQRIDRVLRWALGNQHRSDRVDMALVRDALPPQGRRRSDVRRMPSVPWQEAPAFYAALAHSHSAPEIRLALAFLMLTAVRPGNIASAKRTQISVRAGVWSIPREEMKGDEAFSLPLSPAAIAIVEAVMEMHDNDLLFAVRQKPLSPDTLRMTMRRMKRSETPHGFRSTFKEWARAHGWADHLSEAALSHVDPNEVRAAYARSDLLEERRPMMLAWAAFLEGKLHSS